MLLTILPQSGILMMFSYCLPYTLRPQPPAPSPPHSRFTSLSVITEAIGNITTSAEVSRIDVVDEGFDSRIQGGALVGWIPPYIRLSSDFFSSALGGYFSPLLTVVPLLVFGQVCLIVSLCVFRCPLHPHPLFPLLSLLSFTVLSLEQ